MIRRTARRALALAAAGTLLLSIFSLAHAQARTGSLSERGLGEQACNGLWLAPDASPADGPALDRLRAEALASPEVQLLRKFLRRHGYVARDARAGGTVSSRDSVVLLPLSKRGDRTRGAVVAYAVGADGTRTIEAATLLMRGRAVEAEREYTVNGARVVRTNSFRQLHGRLPRGPLLRDLPVSDILRPGCLPGLRQRCLRLAGAGVRADLPLSGILIP